ncbi:hypothetical protein LNKW23_42970 [Paralimibaculum aggregatum]|uniref:histidine kinase n=1 Tax=Paralimibaculum aggregatum TaxID=3036245 RepID=A0ABQ6LSN9_9RHOB|nr:sensor histidine kinase [Limibaculum sp. NKW23]GMG85081.1 hypothetical protein LNKW23_42970 [Limibaculum sp. NKW23]
MVRLGALSLSVRVPLLVAALMVVVGVIASERVLSRLAETQQRQLRDLAALYLDGLSVAVLPAALRADVWEAYDALERATRQDRSLRALVTTVVMAEGEILASSDPARYPTGGAAGDRLAHAPPPGGLVLSGEAPSVRVQAPLDYQGETIARLHAELDVTELLAERRRALLYLVLGNAAATVLLAAAGYLVVRRMLHPVSLIAAHMRGEGGAGPQPIPEARIPRGANEFSALFRTYNALVAAEREREEIARRAAEHQRLVSLGRLAASVAHEINNPLAGMLATVDTMKRHGDRPGVAASGVALIERGLIGIRNVVQAMLTSNRAEAAQLALSEADFDDLRLLVTPEIRERHQRLDWQVSLGAGARFPVASGPVRQIVLNLLLNATAAAGEGGRVGFRAGCDGTALRLAVSDSGPGLPAAARARLAAGAAGADAPGAAPHTPDAADAADAEGARGNGVGLGVVAERAAALSARLDTRRSPAGETVIEIAIPLAAETEAA